MKEKKTKEFVPKREIKIYVPKELKFEIQAHAENREESMNSFINRAILNQLAQEKIPEEVVLASSSHNLHLTNL